MAEAVDGTPGVTRLRGGRVKFNDGANWGILEGFSFVPFGFAPWGSKLWNMALIRVFGTPKPRVTNIKGTNLKSLSP